MKLVIQRYVVANPSIMRVYAYTYNPEDKQTTEQGLKDYELAIPIADFTENDGNGNISIDGAKFQEVVTQRVIDAQLVANLAAYMETLDLEWDIVITQPVTQETEDNKGMSLAYGGETEAHESTST